MLDQIKRLPGPARPGQAVQSTRQRGPLVHRTVRECPPFCPAHCDEEVQLRSNDSVVMNILEGLEEDSSARWDQQKAHKKAQPPHVCVCVRKLIHVHIQHTPLAAVVQGMLNIYLSCRPRCPPPIHTHTHRHSHTAVVH